MFTPRPGDASSSPEMREATSTLVTTVCVDAFVCFLKKSNSSSCLKIIFVSSAPSFGHNVASPRAFVSLGSQFVFHNRLWLSVSVIKFLWRVLLQQLFVSNTYFFTLSQWRNELKLASTLCLSNVAGLYWTQTGCCCDPKPKSTSPPHTQLHPTTMTNCHWWRCRKETIMSWAGQVCSLDSVSVQIKSNPKNKKRKTKSRTTSVNAPVSTHYKQIGN